MVSSRELLSEGLGLEEEVFIILLWEWVGWMGYVYKLHELFLYGDGAVTGVNRREDTHS